MEEQVMELQRRQVEAGKDQGRLDCVLSSSDGSTGGKRAQYRLVQGKGLEDRQSEYFPRQESVVNKNKKVRVISPREPCVNDWMEGWLTLHHSEKGPQELRRS